MAEDQLFKKSFSYDQLPNELKAITKDTGQVLELFKEKKDFMVIPEHGLIVLIIRGLKKNAIQEERVVLKLNSRALNRGDDRDQEVEDLRKRMNLLENGEKERMEMKKRLETTEMEIVELKKLVKVMSMKEFKVGRANKEKEKKVEEKKELKKVDIGRKKNVDTKGYTAKMKKFHEEMGKFREDFRWKMQGI